MIETHDVYDRIMHLIAAEAVRLSESSDNTDGVGPGACAAAVMSTVILAFAAGYGPHAETVIDAAVKTAKETLREMQAAGESIADRH
jgi:hypothetical protein